VSWDPVWEKIFSEREWGRYPQEDVVRFVARNFYGVPARSEVRILEVGCGPGSGASWFIAREGFRLSGIDGSATAIEKARRRFEAEGLQGEFVQGDISHLPWPDATFDAVLDAGCLGCNTEAETEIIVREIHRVLKPEGRHFSFTMKAGSWGDDDGTRLDATTLASSSEGPYVGMGKVRFATEDSLRRIYRNFADLNLEYLLQSAQNRTREVAHWIVTCRKP
jgi:ubiquinone/menaquinone biosynthesis C-methylase UbiE